MLLEEYDTALEFENEESELATHNCEVTNGLMRLIKRNKQLLHLDLTQCNLTEFMLWKIGASLARAKSLVSLHLSGNQGITPNLI